MAQQPRGHQALACLPLLLLLVLPGATTAASYSLLCRAPAPAPDDLPAGHHGARVEPRGILHFTYGHFSGGRDLHFAPDRSGIPLSFSLHARRSARTTDPAVLHLSATLTLVGIHQSLHARRPQSVSFNLDGYYSTSASSSSELCMVGSGSYARDDGFGVVVLPDAVLRLHVPRPSNLSRPFVTGRLDGAEFGTVTLVAYADDDYAYGEAAASCPPPPPAAHAPVIPRHERFSPCRRIKALLMKSSYNLEYVSSASHAATVSSSPLRLRHQRLYFNQIRCASSDDAEKLRVYIVFEGNSTSEARRVSNYTLPQRLRHAFLVGDEALVAEGSWDAARRHLCLRACRVTRSSGHAHADLTVRDCGVGVSLWFPTVWSMWDRSVAAGTIWNTSSTASDETSGAISLSRRPSYRDDLSYIVYNYTMVEEAKKHYYSRPELSRERKGRFPGNYSYRDFAFSFYVKKHGAYGYASPVTIGSALVQGDRLMADYAFYSNWSAAETEKQRLLNISYDLQYYTYGGYLKSSANISLVPRQHSISAEGVYDTQTGSLCMVACQVTGNNNGSSDCEVLVTAQFAPLDADADQARDRVVGTIGSLRRKHGDPLFFEALDFVAEGAYTVQVASAISGMDMERIIHVASMTLSCVFTALQLLHVKKHPESLPATSVTMLAVLAVGSVVPLVLNLEAVFADAEEGTGKHFVRLTSGGLLELNEFMLRASSMLAFVLQLRLLQLALSSRREGAAESSAGGGGGGKHADQAAATSAPSDHAERSALWVCLPLYLLGAAVVWIVHMNDDSVVMNGDPWTGSSARRQPPLVDDLAGYAGLVLDAFLLPQVVRNAVAGSTVRALSPWFYVGGAAVRVAPHVYDVVRTQNYYVQRSWAPAYGYAGPRDGIFGAAWWDVAVPCVVAVLAVLVFLQQRLGGAFLCCGRRGRRPGEYDMAATLGA